MSRFNAVAEGKKTTNLAGGEAYSLNPKEELASILLTSFCQDQFYRSANDTMKRVTELLPLTGYEFGAKAALYARNEFGMRSITHVVGGEIARKVKGETWPRRFFKNLFKRPDDMTETASYYFNTYGKDETFPNGLKRAIADRLATLPAYQLAKYRGEGKAFKMVDLVNLTHPKETKAIKSLVKGTLKNTDTWEAKLTQAGQAEEGDKLQLKAEVWESLLRENKLGYLAALRNVRNIVQQAPSVLPDLIAVLTDPERIRKSLVFPFQLQKAVDIAIEINAPRPVVEALVRAVDLSLENVPELPGRTLIALDVSGSMQGKPMDIGAIFAAVLYKRTDSDLILFDNIAKQATAPVGVPVYTLAQDLKRLATGGGTNFPAIFERLGKPFDRVIILSDMQGWMGHGTQGVFNIWVSTVCKGVVPWVYSFDLQGYGSAQLTGKVAMLSGFSNRIFDVMKNLEEDRNALINKIESVDFC